MGSFTSVGRCALFVGLLWTLCAAQPALAAEPPFEFDPTLSLTGNCATNEFDPVPDPSCAGNPPAYPPPPGGPASRFDEPRAITVDQWGNEYVASWAGSADADGKTDVFDSEGRFITEFATPNVQSTAVDSKGNFYVFEDNGTAVRYPPSEYKPEEGKIKYGIAPITISSGIFVGAVAIDTSPGHVDELLVTRTNEITRYSSAATGNEVLDGPDLLSSVWPYGFAVDGPRERMFVSFCQDESAECAVKVLATEAPYEELEVVDGTGTPAGEFASSSGRLGIAVDEETGDFFVADVSAKRVFQFNENFEYLSEFEVSDLDGLTPVQLAVSQGKRPLDAEPCAYPTNPPPAPGDACNRHYLFVPVLSSNGSGGRALAYSPPGQTVPVIEAVSTLAIGETEAELRAKIFPGGAETTYHFEIITQTAYEASEWSGATSLGEGTIKSNSLATEVGAFATGLVAGETYRFRAVADNELGPAEEEGQNEAVFTTYNDADISSGCPNEPLRIGPSALLPDCRAYELVTPADTNGRSPKGTGFLGSIFSTLQASPAGGAVSFKIEGGSLPGSSGVGSFEGDPYVSKRTASGWSSELAGPDGSEATVSAPGSFSPDQGYQFWRGREEGSLVVPGTIFTELLYYPDGHSELIGRGSEGVYPPARGRWITEGGTHVIFETATEASTLPLKLEPDAPPTGTAAVYDRTIDPVSGVEETHTVSLLPGDVTPAAGQNALYQGSSKDGEGIAFEIGNALYLRLNNETTFPIGTGVEFAGVSEGGERIFYVEEGDFKAFDTSSEEVIDFAATGDAVPVNVANDGSRAYFVSPSVLGGTNSEGAAAIAPAEGQGTLGARGTGTLSAATGKGTLKKGNSEVTGVTTDEGAFQVGMQISGAGIAEGTTIEAVEPGILTLSAPAIGSGSSVSLTAGSARVTGVSTSQGVFQVGMRISGTGIPADTRIAAVSSGALTLTNLATQAGSTALTAGSTRVTDVSTDEGVFRVGMNITASGIPAGTIITAIDETADTLTLSKEASATDVQPLSAFAQNLYLSEEGAISFIATVTARDSEGEPEPEGTAFHDGLGLWTQNIGDDIARDPSRTNPDGSVLLFQSRANLTGYPESKFPQIYRYDTGTEELQCISCIPTGVPATGGARLESYTFDSFSPQPFSPAGFVPNLNPQGTRVFFDSTEALVSTDTDGLNDVYEWEADGVGSCTRPEGCVYLISSGQSARADYLYGHSTSGDDVFFTTGDKLTGWDSGEGAISIYDARVGGGFPEPVPPKECVGDGCQPQITPPPNFGKPVAGGVGDVRKPKTCPKGKRKVKKNGKVRCVKKKQKKQGGKAKQRAGANRGAGK